VRWLGVARRCHEIAIDRAIQREAFGFRLAELGMIQQMIADPASTWIRCGWWSCTRHGCWTPGQTPSASLSMTEVHAAQAVNRVVDSSAQIYGSLGDFGDIPLARFLNEVRPFRI
jgi:acyl-CoA dehydrogenase